MPSLDSEPIPELHLKPIGCFKTLEKELYQLPNQPRQDIDNQGWIELIDGLSLEQALDGLEGFSHIWVIFWFHQAEGWKPKIMPPRGDKKVGCLASRSPHRPNPIGMSVLELKEIKGRNLKVGSHDLVDGTLILDIKPYLPKVDQKSDAKEGWTSKVGDLKKFTVIPKFKAQVKLAWLKDRGVDLMALGQVSLELYPMPRKGRRNKLMPDGHYMLACKTWRVYYDVQDQNVILLDVKSGYSDSVLKGEESSKWDDVPVHMEFVDFFGDD
jgi:tRNA-Thr(GGU) m(6)t(6)A37 methyltransferase TsaA